MTSGRFFEDLEIGESAENSRLVTVESIADFARVSGDHNPIHLDEEYARKSRFGGIVAHGALSGSYISALLGSKLPGAGSIFSELNLRFKRPVRLHDTIVSRVEVTHKEPRANLVTLAVSCHVDGQRCASGTAKVVVPSRENSGPGT